MKSALTYAGMTAMFTSLACLVVAGPFSWWVAWKCFRTGDLPFGILYVIAYPIVAVLAWLGSSWQFVQRWHAKTAVRLAGAFSLAALLLFVACVILAYV